MAGFRVYGRKNKWRGPGAVGVVCRECNECRNARVKGRVALWYLVVVSLLA